MSKKLASLDSFQYLSYWQPNESNQPKIQVVTLFLQKKDRFLALQRARKDVQHKLWGIPGGKLDPQEQPLVGLQRELEEETQIQIDTTRVQLLGTALSRTPCDGQYGLYLYHTVLPGNADVVINPDEHHEFRWVTIEEFQDLELLTAQREAFLFVKPTLEDLFKTSKTI